MMNCMDHFADFACAAFLWALLTCFGSAKNQLKVCHLALSTKVDSINEVMIMSLQKPKEAVADIQAWSVTVEINIVLMK